MSDYETIQKRRNTAVGVFVIIALCALVGLIYKFGDLPVAVSQWKSFTVKVQFPSAPGVQENTPVQFCGYQIGRVTNVKPPEVLENLKTHKRYHQTVVVLNIDKRYNNIPENVEVKLMTRGLGSSYIEFRALLPDSNEPVTQFLTDNEVLQGSTGTTSEFFPEESQKKLDDLITSILTLVINANEIIGSDSNKQNIKAILGNMSKTTAQATETLKEFRDFSAAGIEMTEELTKAITQLQVILDKIITGKGTAAKFVNDGRLYEELLENSRQLEILIEKLKAYIDQTREKGLRIKLK